MLPDYPALKHEIAGLLDRYGQQRMAYHQGFVGGIARHRAFEGDKTFLRRSTGDAETNDFADIGATITVPFDTIATMTLRDVLMKLDAAAAEMGAKSAKVFYEGLDKTLNAAGQTESARGEKISGALFLKVLERIEMDFDEAGNYNLSLVIHPSQSAAAAAALRELERNPDLREKHRELVERKREAWRVREASRRLVG